MAFDCFVDWDKNTFFSSNYLSSLPFFWYIFSKSEKGLVKILLCIVILRKIAECEHLLMLNYKYFWVSLYDGLLVFPLAYSGENHKSCHYYRVMAQALIIKKVGKEMRSFMFWCLVHIILKGNTDNKKPLMQNKFLLPF